jgi:hypothetical protein
MTYQDRWARKLSDKRRNERDGIDTRSSFKVGDGYNLRLSSERDEHSNNWTCGDILDLVMEEVERKNSKPEDPRPPKVDLPMITKEEAKLVEREERMTRMQGGPRLDFLKAQDIRKAFHEGVSADYLALEYGVSVPSIRQIINNKAWKE